VVPAVIAEDTISFGNGVPSFDTVQGYAVRRAGRLSIEFCLELASLLVSENAITWSSR
jgi:hypothetical protein